MSDLHIPAHPSTAQALAARHQALTKPYTLTSNPLLERQAATESNARSYPRRIPLALKSASGIYVEDVEGRVFIDCLAGAGTLALGHNHPVVIDAIYQTIGSGSPLHTLDLTTPIKDQFMQDVFDILPENFSRNAKIQFCGPTGADGVEAALKLVKTATGRNLTMSFHGAYHGMTQGALQLMGNLGPKKSLNGHLHDVHFLPFPYDYRCPFGLGGEEGAQASLNYINTILHDPESGIPQPAAIILEAIQGEGGVVVAPDNWLQSLRALTQQAGIPLILDEVQTGFGRTGKMFAFEHAGITPDVIVLSKAIGGGLPLSVVVYQKELDQWQSGAHAGTFRGNQMAMATGSASIRYIKNEGLHEHAEQMGQRLTSQLRQLQCLFPQIGDIRGRGLMLGIEIIDPEMQNNALNQPASAGSLAKKIQNICLNHGLILELGGRHGSVIRLLPPLIITAAQIDLVFEILATAFKQAINDRDT